jgi:cob(I)alamin adenosyltransferase
MSERRSPAAPPRTGSKPPPPRPDPALLVLVHTGDGKGKSTAAFGVMLRGLARGWRVCVIQFVKSDKWKVGEERLGGELGVDWLKGGDDFTWESPDLDKSEGRAAAAWRLAAAAIAGGDYQLVVVLDEITYPMNWGWIATEEVVAAVRA